VIIHSDNETTWYRLELVQQRLLTLEGGDQPQVLLQAQGMFSNNEPQNQVLWATQSVLLPAAAAESAASAAAVPAAAPTCLTIA
jgi:hypothetical protein